VTDLWEFKQRLALFTMAIARRTTTTSRFLQLQNYGIPRYKSKANDAMDRRGYEIAFAGNERRGVSAVDSSR
jgi:hypothetical protein